MRKGFLALDTDMLDDEDMKDELAGTTAICVILKDKKIFCVKIIYFRKYLFKKKLKKIIKKRAM